MSEVTQQTGMLTTIDRKGGEVAVAAMAAKAKAMVEARYVMALQRPRNIDQARIDILAACKSHRFAEAAIYKKPVGGRNQDGSPKTVDGFSIRFAETALQAIKNVSVDTTTIYEDDDKRTVHVAVVDLESIIDYGKDVTVSKTVERKKLKEGQVAIGERQNSYGEQVFIVAATEDEIANKIAAQESKIMRNAILRLVRQDILDEAWEQVWKTLEKGGSDPEAEKKKVCDAFAALGIKPVELESYLGHSLSTISPAELADLRMVYNAVKEGEASWASFIENKKPVSTGPEAATTTAQKKDPPQAVDPKLLENPSATLLEFAKRDGVSEDQILAFLKQRKMVSSSAVEFMQASDAKLRDLIRVWTTALPDIKAIQI